MKKGLLILSVFCAMVMTARADVNYYLVGNMNDWQAAEGFMLAPNDAATDVVEFMITLDLKAGAQFKVIGVEEGKDAVWFPDGMGNNYGEVDGTQFTEDAKFHVFFRPNKDGGDDWFYNVIFVQKVEETGIDAILGDTKSVKVMENGQMYIIRNGVRYNLNGAAVK